MISRRPGRPAPRTRLAGTALIAVAAFTTAGCIHESGGAISGPPAHHNPARNNANNNTATWAETAGATPSYIFPFEDAAHFGRWNAQDFSYLLYRPLYWYGSKGSPSVDFSLSLAGPPGFSADSKTVTIALKPYRWSDGESLTPADVIFWMNLLQVEKANWGGYVPGYFPDNVASWKAVGSNQVRFRLKTAYNHDWFLLNELSQITPLPMAWDRTATRPGHCVTVVRDCAKVYDYLIAQNKNLTGYATSKLWGVVDGPWKLASFSPGGALTMVPNRAYSGPVKPRLAAFKEVPFGSPAEEYNTLTAGPSGRRAIQVGYLPPEDITAPASNPAAAGPNPLSGRYDATPWIGYSINYFPLNFNNPTAGPIFRQVYFRQALQYTVDTGMIDRNVYRGYGYPTSSGVPGLPSSPVLAPGMAADQFPFSVSKARSILASHGWNVTATPGTCIRPGTGAGDCGAGIKAGRKLSFRLSYASGYLPLSAIMTAFRVNAGRAGIGLAITAAPAPVITAQVVACRPSQGHASQPGTPCTWQMGDWGGGWIFAPDYYPSGEELFLTGAAANYGSYSDAKNDALIRATLAPAATNQTMYAWERYISQQVPVIWQPDVASSILEVARNLRGVTPLNTFLGINPENWYYVK